LQHAHQLGLIHRDIKPANLFLLRAQEPPGQVGRRPVEAVVKILDWGLARVMPAPGEPIGHSGPEDEAERGRLIGTADYIAPEQAQNPSLVDTRADLYSLGCTFYFLLTGKPPFPGTSLMRKLMQHQEEEVPPLREVRPDVPEEVERIVLRMLAKTPEERFQIPLLVAAALRHFTPGALPSAGSVVRPPSSGSLNALRSTGSSASSRPSTVTNMRPGTLANLPRPNGNGNGNGSSRR
jgi:serine/threonine-protein kinase